MGLMKSLRDKTHIVMIILVLAFVGLMVFEWGMDITGTGPSGQNIVGEVNGEQISYEEIRAEYDQLLEQERQQRGCAALSRNRTIGDGEHHEQRAPDQRVRDTVATQSRQQQVNRK